VMMDEDRISSALDIAKRAKAIAISSLATRA
jgi:hypothetical protein